MYSLSPSDQPLRFPSLKEQIFPDSGILMLLWESTKSPMRVSRVKPYTPSPTVRTSTVEELYITYPADRRSFPGLQQWRRASCWEMSRSSPSVLSVTMFLPSRLHSSLGSKIPKMLPTEIPASMLELPSSGSKHTT